MTPIREHPAPVIPAGLTWTTAFSTGLMGVVLTMTMVVITHEMGFARNAADRILFMDHGVIVESSTPDEFFKAPKEERTRQFLSQILH